MWSDLVDYGIQGEVHSMVGALQREVENSQLTGLEERPGETSIGEIVHYGSRCRFEPHQSCQKSSRRVYDRDGETHSLLLPQLCRWPKYRAISDVCSTGLVDLRQ